jgi:hypothetical protein
MSERDSLLLHFAMLDGLAVKDLREPVEDWVQNKRSKLYTQECQNGVFRRVRT